MKTFQERTLEKRENGRSTNRLDWSRQLKQKKVISGQETEERKKKRKKDENKNWRNREFRERQLGHGLVREERKTG